jgi:hypothetical protein
VYATRGGKRNDRVTGPRRRWRPGLAASLSLLAVGLVGSTPAYAGSNDLQISGNPTVPGTFTSAPRAALFDFSEISPGVAYSKLIAVRNAGRSAGASGPLRVATNDITGILGRELQITIARTPDPTGGADSPATTVFTGSVDSLSRAAIVIPDLGAGEVDGLEFTATLPEGAGNEWENTSVSFNLLLTLSEVGSGASTAAGSSTVRLSGTGHTASRPGGLAFTGGTVRRPLLAAAGLMLLGSALAAFARRRRTVAAPAPGGCHNGRNSL